MGSAVMGRFSRTFQPQLQIQHMISDRSLARQTTHEAVSHLVTLFPLVVMAITDDIPNMELTSYSEAAKMLESFFWWFRLYQIAGSSLHSDNLGSQLSLYWKWAQKHFLGSLVQSNSEQKQMKAAIGTLQSILSKDNKKWKTFVKFRRSLGHPRPFKGQGQATMHAEAGELFRVLELASKPSDLQNDLKIQVNIHYREFLIDAAEKLLSLEVVNDEGQVAMDEIQASLRNLLIKHKLLSKYGNNVAMETDDHMTSEVDRSDCTKYGAENPLAFNQLWPIFEHITSTEGFQLFEKFVLGNLDGWHGDSYHGYVRLFTPWKPGAVVTFKSVSQSLLKDLVPNIQTTLLEGLRKGHCVRNSTLWAQWSGKLAEDNEEVPETKQFTLHQPVLSLVLCMLLSRSDTEVSMTIPPNVKISAPLKSYTRELTQLWFMSQHIWAHVGRISGSDLLSMERRSLLAVFIQSLKALKPVMSKDCPDDLYSDLLDSVATGDDLTPDLLKKLDYTLHAYCTLEHIQKDTSDLLDAAIDSIAKVIGANSDDIGDAVCSEGGFGNLGCLGCAWVDTGLFNMNLLAPQGPVDPVEKVLIKLNIAQNELTEQEAELAVLCSHHRLVTGQDLLQQADRLVHPRVTYLKTRSVELRKQIAELEKQIAFRPAPSQYDMLVMDVRNFLASVGSTENVHGLVTKLRACIGTRSRDACSVSRQYDLWEQSVDKFVQSLSVVYPVYRDITQPLIAAVQQVVHGMGLLSQEVKRSKEVAKVTGSFGHEAGEISQKLEKIVILAGKFPTLSTINPSCLHLATNLTSLDNLDLVRDVVQRSQPENTSADEVLVTLTDSILSGGLYCVVLEAQARGALTPDLLMTLTHILDMYVSSWKHEEAARKVKEAEEASLYRYKTETHGDERSEEEQLEADFLQNFPSFNEDFIDLVEATSMEDSHARKETDQSKTSSTEASSLHLTSSQMTLISGVHEKLYKGLVSTDWYRPVVMATVQLSDWLRPLLSTYTAATILTTRLVDIMSNQVDGHLQGGHLVVAAVQQCYVLQASQQLSSPLVPSPGVYDMYHDPNVPEVIQLVEVLRTVRARVMELQGEWPDHPTLKKLHEIMDRIEEQPITDPVMKFLTGIELLLKTAQDWESNASQHVSMATQLAEISRLIMQWRKLELSCWMNAMDTEVYKFRTEASKWWFHLYQLSQDTLTQQGENCPSLDEFTKALKQFIEKSSLGDFHTRLEMLLSFHCNMVAMATREAKGQVESMETDAIKKAEIGNEGGNIDLNLAADNKTESMVDKDDEVAMATRKRLATMQQVLWNLYKFYGRFSSTVQAELDRLRQPIEKELKGFVKIARWSDINFWALKQTAEKTHRTLHKHIKQFQGVLKLPVQGILGDVESGATTLPAVSGAEYSSWTEGLLSYQSVLLQKLRAFKAPDVTVMNPTLATAAEQLPLQFKLGQLCSRLNKHWITVVMRSRYCERIAVVDQFTGELIEEIHALQALEINRSVEKDKQKSEAKHINLRKRKALSDLFKYLAKLGLSYRKGLTSCDKNEDGALQATPVDLDVSLSGDAAVHQAWDSCEDYFYRCVSRRAQLWSALMTPSRELGTGNIERCKGFAEHLYALLIEQQTSVACLTQQYTGIRTTLADISRLSEDGGKKIHQSETCSWMVKLFYVLTLTMY
ncbi:hypothetical protein DPMN_054910 [Dreissena polymorpha]|uniref:VWFA domain-containing protein n=1 Tax=Dreissena polymorpha TaxID=45954 RepID=A0A9D4CQS2_DREPO|nr:hypothetical protein DPMN_054910 [Dreissena polymorpha]